MQTFEFKDLNTESHMCDYCEWANAFPNCYNFIRFGNGLGNDNIVGCTDFAGDTEGVIVEKTLPPEEFHNDYD